MITEIETCIFSDWIICKNEDDCEKCEYFPKYFRDSNRLENEQLSFFEDMKYGKKKRNRKRKK